MTILSVMARNTRLRAGVGARLVVDADDLRHWALHLDDGLALDGALGACRRRAELPDTGI